MSKTCAVRSTALGPVFGTQTKENGGLSRRFQG
jgi:hypothetical protein